MFPGECGDFFRLMLARNPVLFCEEIPLFRVICQNPARLHSRISPRQPERIQIFPGELLWCFQISYHTPVESFCFFTDFIVVCRAKVVNRTLSRSLDRDLQSSMFLLVLVDPWDEKTNVSVVLK